MKMLVVTPTLGRSPWLADTVSSVAAVPRACTHVLVAPRDVAGELRGRFPTCTVIPEPTPAKGMYAAINAGCSAAQGWDAFTYVNDDDVLLPGFAAVVDRVASRGEGGPFMAYGRVRLIDPLGRRLGAIPVSRFPRLNRALYEQRLEPVYQHGTAMNGAAWSGLGGFNSGLRLCGDSELLARACTMGVRADFVCATVAAFRLRPGQLTKQREAMKAERLQVDAKLGLNAARLGIRHRLARLVFRWTNVCIYLERTARFGLRTFDEILESGGSEGSDRTDHR